MKKKIRADSIIVLAMAGLLMIGWACSSKPTIQQIVTPQSIQAEARQNLLQIYTLELAYRQQHGFFWNDAVIGSASAPLAFAPLGIAFAPETRYSYTIVAATDFFTCSAIYSMMDEDASIDWWTINETGSLICITDDTRL